MEATQASRRRDAAVYLSDNDNFTGLGLDPDAGRPTWALLLDAVEALSGAQSMEEIVDIVRTMARDISGADGVTFVLRDGEECFYFDEDAIGPLWKGQRFAMTACISGWTMLNKQTAMIPDVYRDSRVPHEAYLSTFVKSLVMVPVRPDDPVAAIGAYWAETHNPSEHELELLETLARATSTAIENVMLRYSLRHEAEQAAAQAEEIQGLYDALLQETAELMQAEEQLHQVQKMETIGKLIGGAGHDFNNLLGVIVANLDLMAIRSEGRPEVTELVQEAMEAALKGADLNQRLMAFARCQPQAPKTTDVNEAVNNVFKLLSRTLGENIQINLALSPEPLSVFADQVQMEASITNLAMNARDAMARGGTLSVTTSFCHFDGGHSAGGADLLPGEYVLIEVTDSGVGIPLELQDRIYEPFFSTKDDGKGSGLGLPMVSGFMKQSGGRITVQSKVGAGTTFRMFLPRTGNMPEVDVEVMAKVLHRGDETILLVEDNAAMRRVAYRQLTDLGYHVLQAENAEEAMAILAEEPVDLLFSDVVMPGKIDGIELAQAAQERWPSLKVLLVSGFIGDAAFRERNPGDIRLLTKPYRNDDVARVLREVLDDADSLI
jgi:signal transduction histidine kinase/ActR/RegA family two-component response regulator